MVGNLHCSPLPLLLFLLEALAPGLPRPGHTGRDVVARAIFPLLFLKHCIVHMDVVEHRREIFMAQQLLQAEWVVALDEVVHGKRVSKDMWTDALPGDPRA